MQIVMATDNAGKIREIESYFHGFALSFLPQSTFHICSADETGLTFIENAILKARHAAKISGFPALADDSGLCVPALKGAPGIYSARFAGPERGDEANIDQLLHDMELFQGDSRQAYYYCAIAFILHEKDPTPLIGLGDWQGFLSHERKGTSGFGYDPIFFLPKKECTVAQLPMHEKNVLSHRAKALNQFVQQFRLHHHVGI